MADDNFTREIIHDALVAVGDEMFQTVINTSMSPVIYEVSDFGVGATDSQGNLVAQGNGMIVFVGSLEGAVKGTLGYYSAELIRDGDIFITNSPYEGGGTHLSDVSILCPVFLDNQLIAWTAVKAHWTEIGGMQAGSLTTASTDVFQEGDRKSTRLNSSH